MSRGVGTALRWAGSKALPLAQLVLWLYLYLVLVLSAWVGLGWGVGGWSPVVVTSGSMAPTIHPGDVLLIERQPDVIGQRAIIVFQRDGAQLAHRVFSVEASGYQTKGDANPSPDAGVVDQGDVVGVGRLLVPFVGLPVVWAQHHNLMALGAWAVISLAGALHMAFLGLRSLQRRHHDEGRLATLAVAQLGIRRVRTLVALLIVAHYVLDPARFDVLGSPQRRPWMLATSLVVLGGTNLLSTRAGRRGKGSAGQNTSQTRGRFVPVAELALDSALVVLLATLTGTSGIGWVLFALPIIEAAVRFRLIGALSTWILLTGITLGARIWAVQSLGSAGLLDELNTLLDQLSLLFLVVVPGAYLAEQLMGDVVVQQRATHRALDRGALLESVAQAGFKVSRLGDHPIDAIVEGTAALGFDGVDVVMSAATGIWTPVAGSGRRLPPPGRPGSGLRLADLAHDAVAVDRHDPDDGETAALAEADLSLVVAQTVSDQERSRLVLRAGLAQGRQASIDQIEAFRLLAGQASIALQNDDLLRQLQSTRDSLEHQAHHDALTGLPNRALLTREAVRILARPGERPALFFLDLNGFKPVNDRLGHEMGDALLRLVGQRLLTVAPDGCLVARLGGDEFTLLWEGEISDDEAQALAGRIWDHIREPFELNGDIVHISTSIGLSFGEPGMSYSELIRRADVAMYEAKHGRRDDAIVFQVYQPDFDREEQRRAVLSAAIANALDQGRIRLDYQTIHRLDAGPGEGGADGGRSGGRRADDQGAAEPAVMGVEALLRWHHDEIGEIGAQEILEVAQSTGLRDALNWFVVHQACLDAAAWVELFPERPFFVAFDGWADHGGQGLVDNLTLALEQTGLAPDRLYVEISERLVGADAPAMTATLAQLHGLGVGLLLDDFGQGRSSLSHLHQLPVTGVKLDAALVADLTRSETDRIVAESIVQLCRRLDLVVVAQGITTDAQLDAVIGFGCQLGQGPRLGYADLAANVGAALTEQARRVVS